MKSLIALLAAGSLAFLFSSCERHSWEGSTKKLFEQEHTGADHGKGGHSGHPAPEGDTTHP